MKMKKIFGLLITGVSLFMLTGCQLLRPDYGPIVFNLSGTTVQNLDQPWINLTVQNRTDVEWVAISDVWMEYQDGSEWVTIPNNMKWFDADWELSALSNDSNSDYHSISMAPSLYDLLHPDYPVEGIFRVRVILSDKAGNEVTTLTSGERELINFSFE